MRGNEALTTTLSAVTAAVVGVVLNLAVWFGRHVIFPSAGISGGQLCNALINLLSTWPVTGRP